MSEKKEKLMNLFEKVKMHVSKAIDNTVSFVNEHPYITASIVIAGVSGVAALKAHHDAKEQEMIGSKLLASTDEVSKTNEENSLWREEYRENYERVCEFAKTLNLFEGEMFIIEDQKQYDLAQYPDMDTSHPIVSHLLWNEGVYPPEG